MSPKNEAFVKADGHLALQSYRRRMRLREECRSLALDGSGRAQCREIIANALGVDAEVTAPIARRRAQVDAATRIRRSDPDDDVVGKAHPAASLARFDLACRLVGRDDRPAHLLGCLERSRECRIGP